MVETDISREHSFALSVDVDLGRCEKARVSGWSDGEAGNAHLALLSSSMSAERNERPPY